MRQCAAKAQNVVDDDKMSMADKKAMLDQLEADLKKASDTISLHDQAARLVQGGDAAGDDDGGDAGTKATTRSSLGEQVIKSKQYLTMADVVKGRGRGSYTVELKTAPAPPVMDEGTTPTAGFLGGAAGPLIMPNYLPGIVDLLFPQLVIADLFAQGSTDSPIISYVKETEFTNAAAPVAEKGKKPYSSDAVVRLTEQVGKVAHLMKITDEMMQDAAGYASFLNSRMTLGLQQKEQTELLSGAGYPSVLGLLDASRTASFQTAMNLSGATDITAVVDGIFLMVTNIRSLAFIEPDTILLNPFDWAKIRLGKDKQGQYYAGGPFTGAYGSGQYANVDALWGKRVVTTPAVAAGSGVVGAFKQCAQLFRRQGITLEMTNSNTDDFENNLITVRSEMREALAVYRPAGFGQLHLAWS
jgi:HK97 family phage major capsid protein